MHYWQGTSKNDVKNYGQGELLQWEAIKWAKQNGSKYYDLCVIQKEKLPDIARFKMGFVESIKPFYLVNYKPFAFKVINRISKWF